MTDPDQLQTGRRLGKYELLVPLAQGATAEVWAARTTGGQSDKIVALKVLHADLGDVDAESMFLDEARLVSRIRHPNVGTVLDCAEVDDFLYIVMEWIPGEPLQVVLREVSRSGAGRLPLPLTTRIVALAAAGLHAAHDLCDEAGHPVGLVHRDVSPANLLVTDEGAVKVIDFGVAKAASNLQRTRVGQIKGKIAYMAPEQTAGDRLDRRTDIFALGVVLYQLVTGKHPFRADNEFATMARIRDNVPAESPRVHAPDVPPALEAVMLRALAKARDQRYPTMLDFSRALAEAVPPAPDVDEKLAAFLGSVLSQRVARRDLAIREALRAVGVEEGSAAYPVNFGPGARARRAAAPSMARSLAPVGPALTTSSDALPAYDGGDPHAPAAGAHDGGDPHAPAAGAHDGGDPHAPAAGASSRDVAAGDLPEGMRPKGASTLKIVAAVAVVILLALVAWAATSASGPDEPQPIKRAF